MELRTVRASCVVMQSRISLRSIRYVLSQSQGDGTTRAVAVPASPAARLRPRAARHVRAIARGGRMTELGA